MTQLQRCLCARWPGSDTVPSVEVQAARLVEHGKPLRVETIELPEPGAGEVTVEMRYAGVNPVDRYGAMGWVASDGPVPRTLGTEGSGFVDGRPVVVRGYGIGTSRDGVWSTKAVVPRNALVDVPEGVGLDVASVMGIAGVTAWCTVTERAKVSAADRVIVFGASGGVGSMIVSIVRALGAVVWAQTGNADKVDWLRQLGADHVVVADASSLHAAVRELEPTVVFDPLGNGFFGAAIEAMSERGRIVTFGTSAGPRGEVPLQLLYRKGITVYGYGGLIESDEVKDRYLREALEAQRDGRMAVVIDRVLPLEAINDAFRLLEGREVRGKLVIRLDG